MSKLQAEIQQSKPFRSLQAELFLNLSRTAALVTHAMEHRMRAHGLSPTQYNVLRILRGAGEDGLTQCEVGDRLVALVPDVPRILSRMERAGWIARVRGTEDRRVVRSTLTESGQQLVDELDDVVNDELLAMFPAMEPEEMARMNELLVLAREPGN